MQLHIYNASPSTLTILGQAISASTSYAIPTADLLSFCADLTLRMAILVGYIQLQDPLGNAAGPDDTQDLFRAIIAGEVTTS